MRWLVVVMLASGCGTRQSQDDARARQRAAQAIRESQEQLAKMERSLEALEALERQINDAVAAVVNAKTEAERAAARAKLDELREEFERMKDELVPRPPREVTPVDPTQRG